MEDKQFLDEAGLSEVGKVISKFYASKEDIKDLESLKDFVDKNSSMKFNYVTQKEHQEFLNSGKADFFTCVEDPISIMALEPTEDEVESGGFYGYWNADPISSLYEMGLNYERLCTPIGQPYILINLPMANESTDGMSQKWKDSYGTPSRLQFAFGLVDNFIYWRLLSTENIKTAEYVTWAYMKDPYLTQWYENLDRKFDNFKKKIKSSIINDLIAGGTNKVLSAEQGKILNETKADKKNTDVLFQNLQTIQFRSDQQNQEILNINPDFTVLSGSYVVKPSRIIHEPTDIFLSSYPFASYPSNIGVLTIFRENQTLYVQSSLVKIVQRIYDLNTRVVYIRKTIEYKNEYNNDWICQHYSFDDDLINFCQQIQWEEWSVIKYDSHPFPFASPNEAGFMSPEDKSKLDSIDMDIINNSIKAQDIIDNLESDDPTKPLSAKQGSQLNTQIKNLTQEIESLKTQLNELKTTPKE